MADTFLISETVSACRLLLAFELEPELHHILINPQKVDAFLCLLPSPVKRSLQLLFLISCFSPSAIFTLQLLSTFLLLFSAHLMDPFTSKNENFRTVNDGI